MSIKILEKEKVLAPFLGSPLQFILGLDPLGLLNVGERTFSRLLPGLTSVTDRIRYYCFYCWFFDIYARHIGIASKKEQFKYLRRAEYLIALLAAKNQWQGIPGITKASNVYNDATQSLSLIEGTGEGQASFENTYWMNPRGVFGQNYVSSMVQMGLIRERNEGEGVYIRTDFTIEGRISGSQLAKAFQENVGLIPENIFIDVIIRGNVTQEELEVLKDAFNMRQVPIPSQEHQLIWKLLIGPDEPGNPTQVYFRRRTIQLLLQETIEQGKTVSAFEFVLTAYHQQGIRDGETDETMMLWYYYQLDQFWHMASTGSLQAFLRYLDQKTSGSLIEENAVINEIAREVTVYLKEEGHVDEPLSFNNIHIVSDNEEALVKYMNSKNSVIQVAYAMILLRKLIEVNYPQISDLELLAKRYDSYSQSNFLFSSNDFINHGEIDLQSFIIFFVKKYVILRHQWVALRKMNDSQSTEKFIREDGLIRFVNHIDYGYSNPRIDTLLVFLEDMQIFEDKRIALTDLGYKLYNGI